MKKEYYAAKKKGHYYTFGGSGDVTSAEMVKQSLYATRIYALSAAEFIGGEVVPVHLVEASDLDDEQIDTLFKLMGEVSKNNDTFGVLLRYMNSVKKGGSRELAVAQAFINDYAKLR